MTRLDLPHSDTKLGGSGRRVRLIGLVLIVAAAAAVAANTLRGPRQDGPLQLPLGTRVTARFPLPSDEVLTWGMDLPWDPSNRLPEDIRIESIEPVGARGLEVLGLVLNNAVLRPDGTCLSYGIRTGRAFPPPEVPTRAVKGDVLAAAVDQPCVNHPSVLVGVRRPADSALGVIDALRMLYQYRGTTYELVLPFTLEVRPPDAK